MDCVLSADDALGPAVRGCRDNFDFTLLFEQSFFQIAPCALLLLAVPLRASQLRRQNVKTLPTGVQTVKQTAISLLAASQLVSLALWCIRPIYRSRTSIPAAVLSFLASLSLLVLSSVEHAKSIRPSSIINVYILFSVLLDLPQARTLWLRPGPRSIPAVFTVGFCAKAVILYLEARSKRRSLFPPYRLYAPEALVNLYDRTVLWWLNPLFFQGYRGIISIERLYKIDGDLSSESVETNFAPIWRNLRDSSHRRPLLWALSYALKRSFLDLMIPRLVLGAFRMSQPLLIHRITSLLSVLRTDETRKASRGLIGATVLIYVGLAISNALYQRHLHRLLTKIRGTIVATIHAKVLQSSSGAISDNAALTLISADLERISFSLRHIDQLFASPIEIAVAIFLLERQVGVSCVAPIAFSIVLTCISLINSNVAVPMQKGWLASVQERVAYTAAVLNFPKGFKMLGLTEYLSQRIQALRVKELADYAAYRKYVVHRNTFAAVPQALAPSLCLTMFALINGGSALTPTVAFTALSLVALLTEPIRELIHAVPQFQTALASLDRIQAFLLLEREQHLRSPGLHRDSRNGSHGEGVELSPLSVSNARNNLSIKIESGIVRLGKENKLILDNINIAIAPETLTLIVGPVGSGKSTLLNVLIGDVTLNQGSLSEQATSLGLSYCAQDPWLPNDTVQNLIIGQSAVDEAWYSTVVKACALDVDIDTLPDGNYAVIGTKGVSLSGGQRQRLALARAVYSRNKLLVIDDALSGLDANTSQSVFERVLGPRGLCKRHACTVVFATHAVEYLPEADHVIALGEGGKIVEQGSFDVLRSRPGYVQRLSLKASQSKPSEEQETQEPETALPVPDKLATAEQDLARRTGDIAVYKYYAEPIGWFYGSIIVITAALFATSMTIPNLWVRWWAEAEQSDGPTQPLGLWIGIYLLFGAICIGSVFAHIWVMLVNSVPKSSAQLHKQLLKAVMRAPYSFFVNTDAGVTLNRFSSDMSLIDGQLAGAVMQTMDGCALCITMAGLIVAGTTYAGVAIPFILLAVYAIQKFYLRTSRQLRFMDLESQAPLLTHCSETISGITTIRAFGWQTQSHERCLELLDKSQRPYYLQLCIQRWLNLVLDLTTASIALIVVSMAMALPEASSAGSIGLSMLNILTFNSQLAYFITAWTTLETSLGAVSRCKNFESMTASEDQPGEDHNPSTAWPHTGQLVLNNISAAYNDAGEDVLKNISVAIAPGEKVGVCGRSGSGKSSLLLTLLRLLNYRAGSMILDDVDLATVPRRVIRERITTLPQEAIIVPGTLKDNIDPLNASTDTEIRQVLDQVGLMDSIDQRSGLNADMKDLTLSQGQMQLFAIARALLRKSKLVVLDEMTSSVDAVTEARMLSLVREHFSDSTVIAIAHRLKTIVDFDKVVVMDKGKIVEIGAPGHLLQQENSQFRSMWERGGH